MRHGLIAAALLLCAPGAAQAQPNGPYGPSGPNVTRLRTYTVSALPTCNSASRGVLLYVTDATNPTYIGALTGGGAVVIPVFCNGSAWVAH